VSKNVAVFVDVANIFYAAKAAGADIDYVTLLKAAVAGRDFVRAYAYTGLDPENENQRNFHSFLARNNYKVVSKDIRKYGDGKVKANLDIELVVDMMKTARNLDVAVVVSGDGDFAPAIRAVQEMGVRVEVISFRGNTSSDLIEVADVFTDITQVARVDRDSSRSGRRVAGDEEDLSMTEVPDKQTEGRGGRRGRGRGRDGARTPEVAVAASAGSGERDTHGGGRVAGRIAAGGRMAAGDRIAASSAGPSAGHFVVMPGEKLSRVQPVEADAAEEISEEPEELVEGLGVEAGTAEQAGDGTGRRRRRRGGRGRGHGARTPEEALGETVGEEAAVEPDETEAAASSAAPATRPNQFGSVWDSQIGMAGRPARLAPITPEEDDFAEPEIPEYLLAERRRSGGGGGGGRGRNQGGRGGARSAYASAVDRERYGRSSTRYPEPARQSQPQAQPQPPRRRDERPARTVQPQQQHRGLPRGGGRDSNEPWSEVPPELEELLRAQLANKLSRPVVEQPVGGRDEGASEAPESATELEVAVAVKPAARRGGRRKVEAAPEPSQMPEAAQAAAPEASAEAPAPAAKPATRGRRKPTTAAATAETATSSDAPAQSVETAASAEPAAPKRRAPARRKSVTTESVADKPAGEAPSGE
jgi:uncharacterized LabA/DUF88 family protein